MEVIILENDNAVAQLGAQRIVELVNNKPTAVLGLATGNTQIAMYQHLVRLYQRQQVSFREVSTFNLDEYIGITSDNPQSYRAFMDRELFDAIDIDKANTHLPLCNIDCGIGENPRSVGAAYEQAIAGAGGIDLQLLGIGSNGHIGFNEPTSSLASRTRVKTLTQTTVKANSHLFADSKCQPQLAITMGIATILDARHAILLATGKQKAEAVSHAVEGAVSAMCPASALQMHRWATFILDEDAASLLQNREYYRWVHRQNASLQKHYGNFYSFD